MTDSPYHQAYCGQGHELEFVAEGFALCSMSIAEGYALWWAWSMTAPVRSLNTNWPFLAWEFDQIYGRDGQPIWAWRSGLFTRRDEAEEHIRQEVALRRSQPFDEEQERTRLVPV